MNSRTGNGKSNFLRFNTHFLEQIFEKDGNRADIFLVNTLGNLLHPEAGEKMSLRGLFQSNQFDGMRTNIQSDGFWHILILHPPYLFPSPWGRRSHTRSPL